jgi:hypothetical protein
MTGTASGYLRRIKAALLGDPDARLVFVCNFEVERYWAANHIGLPGPAFSATGEIVRRMEELGALLAGPGDFLLLKQPLDEGYRRYLESLGLALPTVLVPENVLGGRSTTEDALDSPRLLGALAALGDARLMPMGTSELEEKLAAESGLALAVPDAAAFERVNGKTYSRRITAEAGLRPVPGHSCSTVDELASVLDVYAPDVDSGLRVVVKDSFGVSGKGLLVLDSRAKLDGLLRMCRRRAQRSGDHRMDVVVEEWLPKQFDLNYQLTIGRDGQVTLDFVKRALTERGVHKGHLMPLELGPARTAELAHAAEVIGARLFADGYTGIAGIDAILGADGTLYPVLEINARLNMASYQGGLTELYQAPGELGMARHYSLRLSRALSSEEVLAVLPAGVIPTCFGTVNAAAAGPVPFEGRLHVLLIAGDRDALDRLDAATERALATLTTSTEDR